ncbi:membrane protein [Agromyces rhizosphaerae]|uniref:Membrane protein n=1 Tax=Agromyces rhizosphaerae TaxID=88374 RepID=A0A9W6CYJ3_9MICO|nr:DUF4870 domain-containing protein [Agromyces rhizosphaerae]GLI29037.1 membrane protein [Agromyces rhizosphaerae]
MTDQQQPADPSAEPSQPAPLSQSEDTQWASFAHLGGILGFLPSLIIWLIFKDRGAFTNTEAKEALNFQITMVGASIALWILTTILITVSWGLLSPLAIFNYAPWVVSVIFSIIAFLQVKDGNHYRYPFAIRLIK